jgi:hypothetical protein
MPQLSTKEKSDLINKWCRDLGIKKSDLGLGYKVSEDGKIITDFKPHPAIDDVILLINLRNEFWLFWNSKERASWAAYWSIVYHNGYPFRKKALLKLETLAKSGIFRQEQQQLKRQYIRQIRESIQKNGERI